MVPNYGSVESKRNSVDLNKSLFPLGSWLSIFLHIYIYIYIYIYGPPHMAVQKQDDQHEHTFSSYVRIRDTVLKTYLGRWTIGRSGERGSGISVLPARDDDDDIYIYIYIFACVSVVWVLYLMVYQLSWVI